VTTTTTTHDSYAALRVPNFRQLIYSVLGETLGSQIQMVVVGWQVYAFTRDPLSLGLIGLAEALPFISCALLAGHVADVADRRRVVTGALSVLTMCSVSLLVLTMTGAVGPGRVWPFYVVIFLSGIARSFLMTSRTALFSEIVPRELYANAIPWRSSTWQFAAVAGPAAGGLIYGFAGPKAAYGTAIVLIGLASLAIMLVRKEPRTIPARTEALAESLFAGVRFVRQQPLLLGAITLDLFAVLFGGAEALAPVFAAEILHVGPQGLGLIRAAPAAGAVLMAVYLSHRRPIERSGRALLTAVTVFGCCMLGFALSTNFLLSLVLLAMSGMADNVSVVLRSTLLQTLPPREMLGRVAAVNSIFIGSSNEIGAFESGLAAKLLGTVPSVVFGGCMTLLVVAIAAWRLPQLRKLGRLA
jgi:Arabinose efflux permease